MLLPVLLTLLPISLFADVDMKALVAHTFVTDILSAFPLVDLLRLKESKHAATVTWIYGGRTDTDLSAAETWFVECRADSDVGTPGSRFLIVAVVVMVLRVGLEFYFKRLLSKNKERF